MCEDWLYTFSCLRDLVHLSDNCQIVVGVGGEVQGTASFIIKCFLALS